MFIQTESTPNPQTLKFLPNREVAGAGVHDFPEPEAADVSPLAQTLFKLTGVKRVYLGPDFVTITKHEAVDWAHLKPAALAAIMDHYVSGLPVLLDGAARATADVDVYEGEAAEIVEQIQELIDTRVRPAVAQDGGDITFHSWDHARGVVKLEMKGSCAGCPSSTLTLKQGIENMLKHYVPEVRSVEQVT
jgi:NFU1 iron-sulfur cluster scaffold homolog, mitochondrial